MQRRPSKQARCNARVQLERQALEETRPEIQQSVPSLDPLEALLMNLLQLAQSVPDAKKREILTFRDDVTGRGEMDLLATLREIADITGVTLQVVSAVLHEAGVLASEEVGFTFGLSSGGGSLQFEIGVGRKQPVGAPVERKVLFRRFVSFRDTLIVLTALLGSGVGWLVLLGKILACIALVIILFPVAIFIGHGFRKSMAWAVEVTRINRKPVLAEAAA